MAEKWRQLSRSVISTEMRKLLFLTCWILLPTSLSSILLLHILWFGWPSLCEVLVAYWVPFAIITGVLFVLVCYCQLMFWIFFFSCWDGNIGKKFYMSTSLRNLSKSIIFILFLVFVFKFCELLPVPFSGTSCQWCFLQSIYLNMFEKLHNCILSHNFIGHLT